MTPCFPWIQSPILLLRMTEAELAAFEADIIATCAEHEENHWRDEEYRQCVFIEAKGLKYFIKFNHPSTLAPEFSTQSYIYDYAMRCEDAPRIPQALHYFEITNEVHMGYIVMEYMELTHPSLDTDIAERSAWALDWLSRVPAPPEDIVGSSKSAIGPVGGGLIRHRFFKDGKAPLIFSSPDALERYMNKGTQIPSKLATNPPKPFSITNDPLVFTQSDVHITNFGVDECGKTVLLDFGAIGRLPQSFAKFTMELGEETGFVAQVANHLHWPDYSNIRSVGIVASCLQMICAPNLGLDEDGWPVPKKVKPPK